MEFSLPDLDVSDNGSILDLLISNPSPSSGDGFQQTVPTASMQLEKANQVTSIQSDQDSHSDSVGNDKDILSSTSSASVKKGSSSSRSTRKPRRRTSYELERNRLYCAEWRIRKKEKDNEIKKNHDTVMKELQESKKMVEQLQMSQSLKDKEIATLRQRVLLLEYQQLQN